MATQIKTGLPSGEWVSLDNGVAPTFPTLSAGTHLGYDTVNVGTQSQGSNPIADTGTVLLDSVNDTVVPDPQVSTVTGNPVLNTQPTYAKVSTIINNGIRILWKNPAIIF